MNSEKGYWVVTTSYDRVGPWTTEEEAWDEICRIRARCQYQEEFDNVSKYEVVYE